MTCTNCNHQYCWECHAVLETIESHEPEDCADLLLKDKFEATGIILSFVMISLWPLGSYDKLWARFQANYWENVVVLANAQLFIAVIVSSCISNPYLHKYLYLLSPLLLLDLAFVFINFFECFFILGLEWLLGCVVILIQAHEGMPKRPQTMKKILLSIIKTLTFVYIIFLAYVYLGAIINESIVVNSLEEFSSFIVLNIGDIIILTTILIPIIAFFAFWGAHDRLKLFGWKLTLLKIGVLASLVILHLETGMISIVCTVIVFGLLEYFLKERKDFMT